MNESAEQAIAHTGQRVSESEKDTLRDMHLWRPVRDIRHRQYWRAVLVGVGAGAVALLFQQALHLAEGVRASLLTYLHGYHPAAGVFVLPVVAGVIGAFVAWCTMRFVPEAAGSGIPHVKGVLMHMSSLSWHKVLPMKFLGGLLAIGSGFSLGREGPTVQMGAAVGNAIADALRVPPKAKPRLIACGAGAGLAAAFHAPLAGFIFMIEELQRELSALTYAMALIAAVVADIVTTSFWGTSNAFHVTEFPAAPVSSLPVFAVVGVVAGLFGVAFNQSLVAVQKYVCSRPKASVWKRAALIGVTVGFVAWWLPEATGGGHFVAERILNGTYITSGAVLFLVILFIGKFVLTVMCYMSGVPGGIFAPMLVMGATLGSLVGTASAALVPALGAVPASLSVIGMAAFFSAVVRAPLTGIVLVLEMTGDYQQLLPLLIASMLAFLISERIGAKPIYDALMAFSPQETQPKIAIETEPMIFEFVVQRDSVMDGKRIRDLDIPDRCLFVTIVRHATEIIPDGRTVIQAGDHVTAVVTGVDATQAFASLLLLSKV